MLAMNQTLLHASAEVAQRVRLGVFEPVLSCLETQNN